MDFSFFEVGMLVCFGLAWPVSIVKSLRSKTTQGKSVIFLAVVFTGYVSGIIHKVLYSRDIVMVLYILNMTMVGIDAALYFWYKRKESQAKTK